MVMTGQESMCRQLQKLI